MITGTLIVALAGIGATLLSSGLGLYFVSKARSSPLREMLYKEQLKFIKDILSVLGKVRNYAIILVSDDETFKEEARADLGESTKEISELTEITAAILPTEIWVEVRKARELIIDFAVRYDAGDDLTIEELHPIVGSSAKIALMSRAALGVDELSEDTLKLFSSTKAFQRLVDLDNSYFESISKNNNKN